MVSAQGVVIFATMLLAELAMSHGFWYFGSNSNSNTPKKFGGPPPMHGYNLRSESFNSPWGPPPQYQGDSGVSVPGMTMALPVAVPFQPQMGPVPQALEGTLHNVRLVPCLCPVSNMFNSKDYEQQQPQQPQQQVNYAPMPSSASTNP